MKSFTLALLTFLALSITASAQHNLEFSGGYQHVSGNEGLDGFRVGTAWYLHLAKNSRRLRKLDNCASLSNSGAIRSKQCPRRSEFSRQRS
jgi:hypothetical protein